MLTVFRTRLLSLGHARCSSKYRSGFTASIRGSGLVHFPRAACTGTGDASTSSNVIDPQQMVYKKATRDESFANSFGVEVISADVGCTRPNAFVHFGGMRIMINCPDSAMRVHWENWVSPTAFHDVLLTNSTLASCDGVRWAVKWADMELTVNALESTKPKYNAVENLAVSYVPAGNSTVRSYPYGSITYCSVQSDEVGRGKDATCVVFATHKRRGRVNLSKLKEYGLQPGPVIGELIRDRSKRAKGPHGEVSADMILDEDVPAQGLLFMDCHATDKVEEVIELTQHHMKAIEGEAMAVLHDTPFDVVRTDRYRNWISAHPDAQHVFLHRDLCVQRAPLTGFQMSRQHLALVDPEVYRVMMSNVFDAEDTPDASGGCPSSRFEELKRTDSSAASWVSGDALMYFSGNEPPQPRHMQKWRSATSRRKDFYENQYSVHVPLKNPAAAGDALRILFTGAGSGHIHGGNCPGTYLRLHDRVGMMIDCGPGTTSQLIRRFGMELFQEQVRELQCVLITHSHVDHFCGLGTLIEARAEAFAAVNKEAQPLMVVSNDLVGTYLENVCGGYLPYTNVLVKEEDMIERAAEIVGLEKIEVIPVPHSRDSVAFVLKGKDGWSVLFSGDTLRCRALSEQRGHDLMVHEATTLSRRLARKHRHSSVNDAMEVIRRAQPKHAMLYHVGPEVRRVTDVAVKNGVSVALDLMEFSLDDLDRVKESMEKLQLPLISRQCVNAGFPPMSGLEDE